MATQTATRETDRAPAARPVMRWTLGWTRTVVLIAALCLLAGAIGWRIGESDSPSFNDADAGFLVDMTAHHQGALTLSFAYLARQHDQTLILIAQGIITHQSQEIALMNGLLSESGDVQAANDPIAMRWMFHPVARAAMPGLASQAEYDELAGSSGVAADDVFSRLMIAHHASGVAMAEAVVRYGENDTERRMAKKMARQQRAEIAEMNLRREDLGLDRITPDFTISHTG